MYIYIYIIYPCVVQSDTYNCKTSVLAREGNSNGLLAYKHTCSSTQFCAAAEITERCSYHKPQHKSSEVVNIP